MRPRSAHFEGGAAFFSCHSELIKENKLGSWRELATEHLGRIALVEEASTAPGRQVEVGGRGPTHPQVCSKDLLLLSRETGEGH